MIIQKSFQNEKPTLFLVPTPIGNLDEMSPRAIEVLKYVDIIACEDTRTTGVLLKHFDIKTKLISHQSYNEENSVYGIIKLLSSGYNVALCSDAGYPLISDPGQELVSKVSNEGFNVVPLSGANAALNALVASGLRTQPFTFFGFLSNNDSERRRQMEAYKLVSSTMIFYESPHRLKKFIKDAYDIFKDRKCCVAREISKCHEEFIRGSLKELNDYIDEVKGEVVVIIEGYIEAIKPVDMSNIMKLVEDKISEGISTKDAIKEVSKLTGINKNIIYNFYHNK